MPMSLKLKTKHSKSSTIAELFAVDDAMDFVEWIQLYVEQQTKSSWVPRENVTLTSDTFM